MKESDQYHKWVEWSEEDQTYTGKCPDLITGIHGDDPVNYIVNYAKLLKMSFAILKVKDVNSLTLAFDPCKT